MACHLEMETPPTEISDVKRFLNKTKKMYLLYGLGCLNFIAILICLIVDLAVNKGISWSLIAGSSGLFADAFIYALSTCKKNKGCIAMAVISIGAFVLLSVIQITRYYLIRTGTFGFFRYGAPILLLWLFVLWLPVLAKTFLKWSIWDCIALFLFLVIIGNYATKLITGDYMWEDVLHMQGFMGNALGEVIGIIVFGFIGRIDKWRK